MMLRLALILSFTALLSVAALAQSSGFSIKRLCPPNTNCEQTNETPGASGGSSSGGFTNELPRQAPPPENPPGGGSNNGIFTNELPQQPPPPRPEPPVTNINCYTGYQIVRDAGFRRIWAYDCIGTVFRYRGVRSGTEYQIGVRKRDGEIIWTRALR